ncbi:MAG: 5-formyltetrahydrofolate cyclo-ligase [Rickettsiales bacterium]
MNNKKFLREKIIAERLLIPAPITSSASEKIEKYLLDIISENSKVAAYCAMRGEVDVSGLLEKLQARGNKTALPVVMENEKILKFLEVTSDATLVAGKYGISCPQPHLPEIIPDVVIVPLVAFDGSGNRLGYGGGYYDATLAHLRIRNEKLLVIGVAYAMQRVEKLPVHTGDQKMDMVVTEENDDRIIK